MTVTAVRRPLTWPQYEELAELCITARNAAYAAGMADGTPAYEAAARVLAARESEAAGRALYTRLAQLCGDWDAIRVVPINSAPIPEPPADPAIDVDTDCCQ